MTARLLPRHYPKCPDRRVAAGLAPSSALQKAGIRCRRGRSPLLTAASWCPAPIGLERRRKSADLQELEAALEVSSFTPPSAMAHYLASSRGHADPACPETPGEAQSGCAKLRHLPELSGRFVVCGSWWGVTPTWCT